MSCKKLELVFGGGDDDDGIGVIFKWKLVKLDEDDMVKDDSNEVEDKKWIIKLFIECIFIVKDELFVYSLDWIMID